MSTVRDRTISDVEAARILRDLVAFGPDQAAIWLHLRGDWAGNVKEALLRGADRLSPEES